MLYVYVILVTISNLPRRTRSTLAIWDTNSWWILRREYYIIADCSHPLTMIHRRISSYRCSPGWAFLPGDPPWRLVKWFRGLSGCRGHRGPCWMLRQLPLGLEECWWTSGSNQFFSPAHSCSICALSLSSALDDIELSKNKEHASVSSKK